MSARRTQVFALDAKRVSERFKLLARISENCDDICGQNYYNLPVVKIAICLKVDNNS